MEISKISLMFLYKSIVMEKCARAAMQFQSTTYACNIRLFTLFWQKQQRLNSIRKVLHLRFIYILIGSDDRLRTFNVVPLSQINSEDGYMVMIIMIYRVVYIFLELLWDCSVYDIVTLIV